MKDDTDFREGLLFGAIGMVFIAIIISMIVMTGSFYGRSTIYYECVGKYHEFEFNGKTLSCNVKEQ